MTAVAEDRKPHWLRHFKLIAYNPTNTWPMAHIAIRCLTCFAEIKGPDWTTDDTFHDSDLLTVWEQVREHHQSHGYIV